MKEYVNEYFGKPNDLIIVAPNGTYVHEKKANYQTQMKILYGGVFDPYERVLDFVRTREILTGGNYQFYLIGDGLMRNEIFDYINENLVDIIYLGKKSRGKALEIFCDMQIGIAPSTQDIVRKTASPIKVLDYAACGLPIVTVNAGEWSDMIKEYDCGIVTENSDPEEFASAIKRLEDKKIWEIKSKNGRSMVKSECSWNKVLQPINRIYGPL